jgi:hypothetical protein
MWAGSIDAKRTTMTLDEKQPGVFPQFVNQAAFVDRISMAVQGVRRKHLLPALKKIRDFPIAGPGSVYARACRYSAMISCNDLWLKYARIKPFRNIAPFSVSLRTVGFPVTCSEALHDLDALMCQRYRLYVSSAEFTFDITGFPVWRLVRELCSKAQISERGGEDGSHTVYVGSPRSCWQARIYRKTFSTARVEFMLHRDFLRSHGIHRPQDLLRLKQIPVWDLLGFRKIDRPCGRELPPRLRNPWLLRDFKVPPDMPTSIVLAELRKERVDPQNWIVPSDAELLLRKMQQNFVW